jgi:tetratricopeptide (TPR) repeat protein
MRCLAVLPILLVVVSVSACSTKKLGINRMADALTSTASSFSRDDDPEFVRAAAPSNLKMIEMLLDEEPHHPGLLLTACSGFTQYAYGFLQADAERLAVTDPAAAGALRGRARRMYERASGYCGRALDVAHPGLTAALESDPRGALAQTVKGDVPALFWFGAASGGALSLADNQLLHIGQLATVRAALARALALDEGWERGAIHEAMIALDGLPTLLGGSHARAREHFDRAVALSNGHSAFAYVTLASSVSQPAKDRAEFERLLKAALAIDPNQEPSLRLANLIAQARARFLLSQVDHLF